MNKTAKLMLNKACSAMKKAYAPYSKYLVGACILSDGNKMFTGCNIENASYGATICAERAAISSMVSAGKKKIKALAVVGSGKELCTPCGICRQVIREFAPLNTPIYLCDSSTKKIVKTVTLEELLPMSFGPDHLNKKS